MKLKKGFTLIELLVVIAIIAILAAILFPVLSRARVAAKVTQTISAAKQINLGFQMYVGDNDETWPLWSAGMGCDAAGSPCGPAPRNSPFYIEYMYQYLVAPYIKNGVDVNGNLTGIWASPNSKPLLSSISNTWAYNHWTLGGFSSCARNPQLGTLPAICTGRTTAQYMEFAGADYNFPASTSSLASPSETIVLSDGPQLSRPPMAYAVAFPTNSPRFIGVWGPHDMEGGLLCSPGNVPSDGGQNARRLEAGKRTVVTFADSSVKNVPTQTLYSTGYYVTRNTTCTGANIVWRGSLNNNRGWSRDWGGN